MVKKSMRARFLQAQDLADQARCIMDDLRIELDERLDSMSDRSQEAESMRIAVDMLEDHITGLAEISGPVIDFFDVKGRA